MAFQPPSRSVGSTAAPPNGSTKSARTAGADAPQDPFGLRQPTAEELVKITQKNTLLNVLGNEGQQISIVGDTSVGKSTTINFLLGFPINFEAGGVGTRRPCVISQVYAPEREEVKYVVRICKAGSNNERVYEGDMLGVANYISECNNPQVKPEYFDAACEGANPLDPNKEHELALIFDDEPVTVEMHHKSFTYGFRFIDLPGLTRRTAKEIGKSGPSPADIARKYIQPGNVTILVIGKDNAANAAFPDLAEQMAKCSQVLFIQNYAVAAAPNIKDNYNLIKSLLIKEKSKLADSVQLFCMDPGKPRTPEFIDTGLWNADEDQQDWKKLSKTEGAIAVQRAMWQHSQKTADLLEKVKLPKIISPAQGIGAGIGPVLQNIIDYQFSEIDIQINDLQDRVRAKIKKIEEMKEAEETLLRTLDQPPQWQAMKDKAIRTVVAFLDTTIEIPESMAESSLMTSEEEAHMQDHRSYFIDESKDEVVRDMLTRYTSFEGSTKLACLRSWFRLLEELTGMLAFVPMPVIQKSVRMQAMNTFGSSDFVTDKNKVEQLVRIVASSKLGGQNEGRDIIEPMLQTFKARLLLLMKRDISNAMEVFAKDTSGELGAFLDLLDRNTPEERKKWVDRFTEAIQDYAMKVMCDAIDGEYCYDELGNRIPGANGMSYKRKVRSGLTVYQMMWNERSHEWEENKDYPILHWLLPFKKHFLNGQIPWKDLRLDDQIAREAKVTEEALTAAVEQPNEDELLELLTELKSDGLEINAMNAVNLMIFKTCTEVSDVKLHVRSASVEYDLEVMKLLKAMQSEISAFYNGWYPRRIQRMKDDSQIKAQFTESLEKALKKSGSVVDLAHKENLYQAVYLINKYLAKGPAAGPELTTADELKALPSNQCWTEIPRDTFVTVLRDFVALGDTGAFQDLEKDKQFPFTMDIKFAGELSWIRLCQEFIFVILQLSMKRVSQEEACMAQASTGASVLAGPQEIVSKLTLHRLSRLGQANSEKFKKRFERLWERDFKNALKKCEHLELEAVGDQDGLAFITEFYNDYFQKEVNLLVSGLLRKFKELTPFDFSTMNGRLPLDFDHIPMQGSIYSLDQKGYVTKRSVAPDEVVNIWCQPIRSHFPLASENLFVTADPRNASKLVLDEKANQAAFLNINTDNSDFVDKLITASDQQKDKETPFDNRDLDGCGFHDMALRVFKAIQTSAIEHISPQLKKAMQRVYQEKDLQAALQGKAKIDYEKEYGDIIRQKYREVAEHKARIESLQAALDRVRDGASGAEGADGYVDAKAAVQRLEERMANFRHKEQMRLADQLMLQATAVTNAREIERMEEQVKSFKPKVQYFSKIESLTDKYSLKVENIVLSNFREKMNVFAVGYYAQFPGWQGKNVKACLVPPKDVKPFQYIFETKRVQLGKTPGDVVIRKEDTNPWLDGDSFNAWIGFKMPKVYPIHEYCLCIEVVKSTTSYLNMGMKKPKKEHLFTIIIPFAYMLKDKREWKDFFPPDESKRVSESFAFAPDNELAFQMEDRTLGSEEEKTFMFTFEEARDQYEAYDPKFKNLVAGSKISVTIKQIKD
eukprot:TRINITY_DN9099_c0_g5_i1.p1 TRINITY_DN9099_c0_g5~~TRINITY_DN9099_c0_g5_i1.p1  ORF type:complete len:1560 (+),score=370.82 TRINITY_DN9099_c0_g5_i1:106-4785(+)